MRDELHVDGGTTRKVFIAPLQLSLRSLNTFYSAPPCHRFYIIANTKLTPEWKATDTSLPSIAQNALAALGRAHAAGDLFRLYLLAKREGADSDLAAIPKSFSQRPAEPFEPRYMRALFQVGLTHQQWLKEPPELERGEREQMSVDRHKRPCT